MIAFRIEFEHAKQWHQRIDDGDSPAHVWILDLTAPRIIADCRNCAGPLQSIERISRFKL